MNDKHAASNRLISELASDADMVDLVEMYVEDLPDRIAAMEQSLAEQDLLGLTRLAHQMKGAAGGYGFPTITLAARELEMTAKGHDDLDAIAKCMQELAMLCGRASARP